MFEITPRIITLLIAFPIVIGIFTLLGILVIRKDRNYWGNRLYSLFFWIIAVGLTCNVSYVLSDNLLLIKTLNITTLECVNVGIIALLLGNLVIYKGEPAIIGTKKTTLFILTMLLTITAHVFTPDVITIPGEASVIWTLPFGVFEIIFSQIIILSTLYISSIIYKELPQELRSKFKWFLIGLVSMDISLLSITLLNMQILPSTSLIPFIINFSCLICGSILIYFGIVRKK